MARSVSRVVIGVLCLLFVVAPVSAKHSRPSGAAPTSNFVNVDLTAPAPAPPPPGSFRLSVVLLDAASIVHSGDKVTFDALDIWKTFGHYMSGGREVGPPEGTIAFNTLHYQASCGWRTVRSIPSPATLYIPGQRYQPFAFQPYSLQDGLLAPLSEFTMAIDKICEGQPIDGVKGYRSIAEAVSAWNDNFSSLPISPMVPMPRPVRTASSEAWEGSPTSHRFRIIATDGSTGNLLLLDFGSVARDGQMASAQSLVLLGPDAERFSGVGSSVAVLRNVHYDCTARSMTVMALVQWDRNEQFAGQSQTAFAPRGANDSPIINSEIDAACGSTPPSGTEFSSVQAAWHALRDGWAPSPMDTWLPCLWNHVPKESQDTFVTQWTGAYDEKLFQVQQSDVQPLIAACAIPLFYADLAFDKLRFYATERAALQRLTERELGEAMIVAAWRDLGWTKRLSLVHDYHSFANGDFEERRAFEDKFATSLGLRSSDADGRKWLGQYINAQAWIEGP